MQPLLLKEDKVSKKETANQRAATQTMPPALRSQLEHGYEAYLASKPSCVHNRPLREPEQTFADAMCEGSIVEGLSNGQEILGLIKNAGRL
jgi:hypothetical protein